MTIETIPTKKDELRATLEELRRTLPVLSELSKEIARYRRVAYDAYIAEGFTPEQALILCQKSTL